MIFLTVLSLIMAVYEEHGYGFGADGSRIDGSEI